MAWAISTARPTHPGVLEHANARPMPTMAIVKSRAVRYAAAATTHPVRPPRLGSPIVVPLQVSLVLFHAASYA
jgi:hypothetical protein